jgi:hypothetical protein
MKPIKSSDAPTTVTATEARAGRIVKGGAVLRLLVISAILAAAALLVTYLILS